MALRAPVVRESSDGDDAAATATSSSDKSSATLANPSRAVRTSSRDQKLDKHRYHNSSSLVIGKRPADPSNTISPLASIVFARQIKLTSVDELRRSIDEQRDDELLEIVRHFVYVGTIDGHSSLIQHETQLYLVDTRHLSQELFFQLCLYHFGNFGTIRLESDSPTIEVSGSRPADVVVSSTSFVSSRN
jgi:DNA mismatch repair ATPase MutL